MSFLSRYPRFGFTRRAAASFALACALVSSGAVSLSAQDATPDASPVPTTCEAPEVEPGTPDATPDMAMATPDMATPVAADLPEGEEVQDDAVITELSDTVSNLAACYNSGDGLAAAALHTESYLTEAFGTGDLNVAAEILSLQSELGALAVVSLDAFTEYPDGSYGVDVHYLFAKQLFASTLVFVEEDGFWKLDQEAFSEPSPFGDTTTLSMEIADAITVLPAETGENEIIVLYGANDQDADVFVNVFAVPDDFDLEGGLETEMEAELLPENVTFVGAETFAPGDITGLYFQDLTIGTYAVYGYVGDEEEPSLSGSFIVTEPIDLGVPDILGTPEATPED